VEQILLGRGHSLPIRGVLLSALVLMALKGSCRQPHRMPLRPNNSMKVLNNPTGSQYRHRAPLSTADHHYQHEDQHRVSSSTADNDTPTQCPSYGAIHPRQLFDTSGRKTSGLLLAMQRDFSKYVLRLGTGRWTVSGCAYAWARADRARDCLEK